MITQPRSFGLRKLSAALLAAPATVAAFWGVNPVVAFAADNPSGQNTCPTGDHGIYDYAVYVNGKRVPRLLGYVKQGDDVTVDVKACATTEVSLASYTTTGPTWDYSKASEQKIYDSSSVSLVDGQQGELKIHVPTCFNQEDLVYGAPIKEGAPIYTGRLIDGNNGGTQACPVVTPSPTPSPTPTPTPPPPVTHHHHHHHRDRDPWLLVLLIGAAIGSAATLATHRLWHRPSKASTPLPPVLPLPLIAPPAKIAKASVSAHAMVLLGTIMERHGIRQDTALSEAARVQAIVDEQTAAGNTLYAVRGRKVQVLFDAQEHHRKETTSVVSFLARLNTPCAQGKLADILSHPDTSTNLAMESGAAATIAKFAGDKGLSHGAAVENSLFQLNRVGTKLHAKYRIVAAKSLEEARTAAAIPIFTNMSDLSAGQDAEQITDAQVEGRTMSDNFRSLPHYKSRSGLRNLTLENHKVGFHPDVQVKIDKAQTGKEALLVA